jgi:hypothetical protein
VYDKRAEHGDNKISEELAIRECCIETLLRARVAEARARKLAHALLQTSRAKTLEKAREIVMLWIAADAIMCDVETSPDPGN